MCLAPITLSTKSGHVQACRLVHDLYMANLTKCFDMHRGQPTSSHQGPCRQGGEPNAKVARVALLRMVQDRGEPIRSFAARLRRQAEVCMFTLKCTGCARINNQEEQRVADQLCIGLADPEIQEDLLKDPNQAMSVEETIRFVEVRAAGQRSAVTITTPTSTNVRRIREKPSTVAIENNNVSQRHAHQLRPQPQTGTSPPTTKGKPTHPSSQPMPRLPMPRPRLLAVSVADRAMGNVPGQPSDGCNAQPSAPLAQPAANPTITHLCAAERESAIRESVADMTEGTLPHQTWDSSTGSWVKQRSPPQPNLDVLVSTHQEDYKTHGHTLRRTWLPPPLPTQDARAAWQDQPYRRNSAWKLRTSSRPPSL